MDTKDQKRPVGFAIIVLLCTLVVLLALMVAGSKFLVGYIRGTLEGWQLPSLVMLVTAALYGLLGFVCWRRPAWLVVMAPLSLLVLALLALPELAREGVLDLAVALVFLLAGSVSLGAIAFTRLRR